MALITPQQVADAYAALATGHRDRMLEHLGRGHALAGSRPQSAVRLEEQRRRVHAASWPGSASCPTNSFRMDTVVSRCRRQLLGGRDPQYRPSRRRAEPPPRHRRDPLDDWRDGKVIEARGAIFGDGTAQYDAFWA